MYSNNERYQESQLHLNYEQKCSRDKDNKESD